MKEKTDNIDILEELKKWFNNFDLDSIKHKPEEYIQAISTLIAESKELKEKNKRYEEIYKNYGIDDLVQELEKYRAENKELKEEVERQGVARAIEEDYIEKNFINKNEIKEEIQELKNMKIDGEVFKTAVNYAIKILQSLLGKE